jgi:hypothetical protein
MMDFMVVSGLDFVPDEITTGPTTLARYERNSAKFSANSVSHSPTAISCKILGKSCGRSGVSACRSGNGPPHLVRPTLKPL